MYNEGGEIDKPNIITAKTKIKENEIKKERWKKGLDAHAMSCWAAKFWGKTPFFEVLSFRFYQMHYLVLEILLQSRLILSNSDDL